MTCRHESGPKDVYVSEVGQYENRLRWHKTYCKKCRQLINAEVVDPKPPPLIDQPYLLDGSFDISVNAPHNDSVAPHLTGEPNDNHPLPRTDNVLRNPVHRGRTGFLSLVPT